VHHLRVLEKIMVSFPLSRTMRLGKEQETCELPAMN